MTHAIHRLAIGLACLALLCVASPRRNLAQTNKPAEAAPKHRLALVNEYIIKPGLMAEFLEWAKNGSLPLYVKAGIKEAYFFTIVYGERQVAVFFEMHDSFAAIKARNDAFTKSNSAEARTAWLAKANNYIESTRTYIAETLPELSWSNPNRTGPPPYLVAVRSSVGPFRGPDYERYLKTEYLPLVKKAGAAGLAVSRVRFGGDVNEYRMLCPLDDLADLDQDNSVTRLVGAEALRKLQQKALTGIVLHTESDVLRLRADISIIPSQNTAAR